MKNVFGSGSKVAVILSPILPEWDEGEFCLPLVNHLVEHGYQVHLYDSLSLTGRVDRETFAATAEKWDTYLRAQHLHIDLAVGQAYGGALMYALLSGILADCPRVLGLSAPTHVSAKLRRNLQSILTALDKNGESAALHIKDFYLKPARGETYADFASDNLEKSHIGHRLRTGFNQLMMADARTQVEEYTGRLLVIYGSASRLVNGDSITLSNSQRQQICCSISGCGMRPLSEATDITLNVISNFLN